MEYTSITCIMCVYIYIYIYAVLCTTRFILKIAIAVHSSQNHLPMKFEKNCRWFSDSLPIYIFEIDCLLHVCCVCALYAVHVIQYIFFLTIFN